MEANPDLCMCMDFNHGCGGLYVRRPMGMVYYGVCVCVCVYKIDRVRLCECSSVWIKAIGGSLYMIVASVCCGRFGCFGIQFS